MWNRIFGTRVTRNVGLDGRIHVGALVFAIARVIGKRGLVSVGRVSQLSMTVSDGF